MIWLLTHPFPLPSVSSTGYAQEDREGWGWGGAKSYDSEKAWPSINHSILSVSDTLYILCTCMYVQDFS
jgi:hypothetical protein